MAPSAKKLEAALIDGTCEVYKSEPDATSVNKVRKHVEEQLGLEHGFFSNAQWKQKSKITIKEIVEKLLDGWQPEPKPEPDSKNGIKRQTSEPESPKSKRQKRESKPISSVKKEEPSSSELSNLSDLSEEEKPKNAKSAVSRRKSKKLESDEEDAKTKRPKSSSTSPERKRKRKPESESDDDTKSKAKDVAKTESDEEDRETNDFNPTKNGSEPDSNEVKPAVDEEEEGYSDVIDEGPKPKRKKKEKRESVSKKNKPAKVAKPKAPSSEDPQEAEIKKLQSQLNKCGVRKMWHNELKQYGSDSRAKIRHLKKMLSDVGMDGRFSEAKAREIKDLRELKADAEAAQEMNSLWGAPSEGRASRSKAKSRQAKPEESDGSEAGHGDADAKVEDYDDDDDEEEEHTSFAARRRARADLAFLGDDSDSD